MNILKKVKINATIKEVIYANYFTILWNYNKNVF